MGSPAPLAPTTTAAQPVATTQPDRAQPTTTAPSAARAVALDTAVATKLLLRDTAATIESALLTKANPALRQAAMIRAANRLITMSDELVALSKLQPLEWHGLGKDLAGVVRASRKLDIALVEVGVPSLAEDARDAVELFSGLVPPEILAAAEKAPIATVASPTSSERIDLCRQTIAATRRAISEFHSKHREADRSRAIELCTYLTTHVRVAGQAAAEVARADRLVLTADVQGLSEEMSRLAQLLAMTPKLEWDEAFASTFDAELQVRTAVGLGAIARPYTGTVDPKAALAAVSASKDGHIDPKVLAARYQDPQSAANGALIGMKHVLTKQRRAIENLERDLEEPPPPKDASLFDSLLEAALNIALGGAAGAIGGLIGGKLKSRLEGSAKQRVEAEAGHLSKEAKDALVKQGDLGRAIASDSVKDMSKQLFRELTGGALNRRKPKDSNAAQPRNAYIQQQLDVIDAATNDFDVLATHIAPALQQLELGVLDDFAHQVQSDELQESAYAAQYDASMRAWLNFHARIASPWGWRDVNEQYVEHNDDPKLAGPGQSRLVEETVPGVIEVGAKVDADPSTMSPKLVYVILRDGEAAAIRHLKKHASRVEDAKVDRQYHFYFGLAESEGRQPYSRFANAPKEGIVRAGVGLTHGFQVRSVSRAELDIVKLYLAGILKTSEQGGMGSLSAMYDEWTGDFRDIPDEKAIEAVRQLIARLHDVSTSELRDP